VPDRSLGIPQSWLSPIAQLAALYNEYGSLPRAFTAIISSYIVSSVFGLGSYVVDSVLSVFDVITFSLGYVQRQIGRQAGFLGINVLGILRGVQRQIGAVIESLGPAGPPVAITVFALILFAVYRIGVALLGELPVGSSLIDTLGLRP